VRRITNPWRLPVPDAQNTAGRQWDLIREALPWREYGMEPPIGMDYSLNEVLAVLDSLRTRYERMEEFLEDIIDSHRRSLQYLEDDDGDATPDSRDGLLEAYGHRAAGLLGVDAHA
jgi:hypothetical protein